MSDDVFLLTQLRSRSPEAFQELFHLYSDKIFRLAVSILDNEDDAEDVVQEVFIRFFEKLDTFEGRSKIGTWLYRTAYNTSIDRLRKHRSVRLVNLDDLSQEDLPMPNNFNAWVESSKLIFDQEELRTHLDEALKSLPENLRMAFLLRDVEEISTKETAAILNITPGAVKVRLHRARLLMRELLSEVLAQTE